MIGITYRGGAHLKFMSNNEIFKTSPNVQISLMERQQFQSIRVILLFSNWLPQGLAEVGQIPLETLQNKHMAQSQAAAEGF